jgi:RHS repeat-associated protein
VSPTILDTLPLTVHANAIGSGSTSFTYTVPSGGSNKLLVILCACNAPNSSLSATQNGTSLATFTRIDNGTINVTNWSFSYLATPSSGTFVFNNTNNSAAAFVVFTLQNAALTNPTDAYKHATNASTNSLSVSTSTAVGSDILLSMGGHIHSASISSYGTSEAAVWTDTFNGDMNSEFGGSWKPASTSPTSETMTTNWSTTNGTDQEIVAIKAATVATATTTSNTYTYAGTGYANPDAVTQIANGLSTTTFVYDNNGNVTQKTTDGTTTTYVYDYANRLTALGVLGATTTYAYDAFGQRVLQTGTTTTYLYPFKWYSVASSTGTAAKFATTTDYVFNGDSLVATVDQQTASGNATGTAKTRYIHPDHLGSTNVVTDENDNISQTLDYFPYGGLRVSVSSSTNEQRQFIGQFADQSNLDYLQARYYDQSRGQFLTQDPLFSGNPKDQDLANPQSLNTYAYANDNPITRSDPNGKFSVPGYAQGYLQGIIQQAIAIAQLVIALSTHPVQTVGAIGSSIVNTASNPQAIVQSTASAAKNYAGASDYEQSRLSGYYGAYLTTALLAGGTSRAASIGGESAASADAAAASGGGEVQFANSSLGHIFRDATGHVADTPENRQLILRTANNPANYLGTDAYGNTWHAASQPDGSQVWTVSRNGTITNAGVNQTSRTFNAQTGLSAQSTNQ